MNVYVAHVSIGEDKKQRLWRKPSPVAIRWLPPVLLVLGVALFVAAVVLALAPNAVVAVIVGAASALVGIILTYVIARDQDRQSDELSSVVSNTDAVVARVETVLLELREQASARDYIEADDVEDPEDSLVAPSRDGEQAEPDGPWWREEALERLRVLGAGLDENDLRWRKRTSIPRLGRNQGWFVESPGKPKAGRWFVRKANGMNARKAMPRDHLEALEQQASLDPREIQLDFQLKDHGLAAWYARTYSGDLWKVTRSNRSHPRELRAEKMEE